MTNNRNAHCVGDEYRGGRAAGPAHHRCAPAERAGLVEAGGDRGRGHGVHGGAAWAAVARFRRRRGDRCARPPAVRARHLPAGAAAVPPGHRQRRRRGARRAGRHPLRRRRHRQRRRGSGVRRAAPPRRRGGARRRVAPAGRHRRDRSHGRRAQVLRGGGMGHRAARAGRGCAPAPRRRPVGPPRVARARAAHRAGVRDRRGARRRRPGVLRADRRRPSASATRRRHAGWSP